MITRCRHSNLHTLLTVSATLIDITSRDPYRVGRGDFAQQDCLRAGLQPRFTWSRTGATRHRRWFSRPKGRKSAFPRQHCSNDSVIDGAIQSPYNRRCHGVWALCSPESAIGTANLLEYDYYNREERAICSHLFRLLHEWISPTGDADPMLQFLDASGVNCSAGNLDDIKIFTEVALIRDAYFIRKPDVGEFMDALVEAVVRQENLSEYRRYSEMPSALSDPSRTHPSQIRRKAQNAGVKLSNDEQVLFGAIQGMFNAKPDLAITVADAMVVYEAKYTEPFDTAQLKRTERIAEVWSKVLYRDVGFDDPPHIITAKLGPARFKPDLSWEWIAELAEQTYPPTDRTRIALTNARRYLADTTGG